MADHDNSMRGQSLHDLAERTLSEITNSGTACWHCDHWRPGERGWREDRPCVIGRCVNEPTAAYWFDRGPRQPYLLCDEHYRELAATERCLKEAGFYRRPERQRSGGR